MQSLVKHVNNVHWNENFLEKSEYYDNDEEVNAIFEPSVEIATDENNDNAQDFSDN